VRKICDLVTGLAVASTVIGGAAALQQADASAKASTYNAQVAEMNAVLSQRRAKDAMERGAKAEQQKRMEISQLQGRQRAAMAANGVDIGYGSSLDTLIDTAYLGELDALTIRRNAAREAYDFEVDAVNGRADASLSRANADSAMMGGYLNAASTVLGGASSSYKSYRDYNRPTIGGY
jgi:hypothetical protein